MAAPQHWTKTERKNFGMNARPSPDDIVAIFMHRHNHRKRYNKTDNSIKKPAQLREKCD